MEEKPSGFRFKNPPKTVIELKPKQEPAPQRPTYARARRIWGTLVFGIGLLWLVGGVVGLVTGQEVSWLLPVLGLVLTRMGWNLRQGGSKERKEG
jgi:hypothetical protein